MAKNSSIETFTQIPDWYWQCGLDIYEVNIIARIASWQRQDKVFYEGKKTIAKIFGCDFKVILRRFEKLENMGIIVRGKKKGRSYCYTINSVKLNQLHKGTLEVPIDDRKVPQRYHKGSSEVLYNTNNTSNKTSVRAEGALKAPSTQPESALKPNGINSLALEQFINDLNEDRLANNGKRQRLNR